MASIRIKEGFIRIDEAELFYREIGRGRPLIILHGGPGFDHTYLLPDLDKLASSYRLIYYDQRGGGRSRGERLDDIHINTYINDLDTVISYFRIETAALVGHSWGGHLAIQFAIAKPERVSHLLLMNTAPASYEGGLLFIDELRRRKAPHAARLNEIIQSAAFKNGEPEEVTEYYRIVFGTNFKKKEVAERLNLNWSKENILRGREVEKHLLEGLYLTKGFSIIPQLKNIRIPTLILHGDDEHIPLQCAVNIADAIPGSKLVVLKDSGHFSYIDAAEKVKEEIDKFFS